MIPFLKISTFCFFFLVACTRLYNPLCPSVGRSVGRSVTFYFFLWFYSLTSLLLPKWSSDLKYGPCPPARDFGSRVSSLVWLTGNECWIIFQNECIESYPIVCSSSVLVQKHFTLVTWIVFFLNGYQVNKGKSSEFLANLEKNLANSSDFLGAN